MFKSQKTSKSVGLVFSVEAGSAEVCSVDELKGSVSSSVSADSPKVRYSMYALIAAEYCMWDLSFMLLTSSLTKNSSTTEGYSFNESQARNTFLYFVI